MQKSAVEDHFQNASRAVQFGRWLFKRRDYTPGPVIVLALLFAVPAPQWIAAGIVLVLAGEAVRIWGISYIGGISRVRSDKTGKLILSGPFGRMRNPLYVGNLLVSTGAFVMTGLWFLVPVFILLFFVQYHFIVRYEESNLERIYAEPYRNYLKQVPRWLPLGPGGIDSSNPLEPDLKKALRSERKTFLAIGVLTTVFIAGAALLKGTSIFARLIALF